MFIADGKGKAEEEFDDVAKKGCKAFGRLEQVGSLSLNRWRTFL